MQVSFQTSKFNFMASFDDCETVQGLSGILPLEAKVKRWGDEIYFEIGHELPEGPTTTGVKAGDVAYWPEGRCLCVFFGPTPASSDGNPVPASPVVVIGRTVFSPDELRSVSEGEKIVVEFCPDTASDTRIMSQSEIDDLIKRMRG